MQPDADAVRKLDHNEYPYWRKLMPIPLFLLGRIRSGEFTGDKVVEVFQRLAKVADRNKVDQCAINLDYKKEGDELVEGDLLPVITLSLERHMSDRLEIRPMSDPDAKVVPNPDAPWC